MKRATLIKMKNGRHRVATRSEARSLIAAANEKQTMDARLERLQRENATLREPFEINSELADRLAKEFGFKVWPVLEKWVAASQRPRRTIAFSDVAMIPYAAKPIRRHTVHIPEIVFCYDEEL